MESCPFICVYPVVMESSLSLKMLSNENNYVVWGDGEAEKRKQDFVVFRRTIIQCHSQNCQRVMVRITFDWGKKAQKNTIRIGNIGVKKA